MEHADPEHGHFVHSGWSHVAHALGLGVDRCVMTPDGVVGVLAFLSGSMPDDVVAAVRVASDNTTARFPLRSLMPLETVGLHAAFPHMPAMPPANSVATAVLAKAKVMGWACASALAVSMHHDPASTVIVAPVGDAKSQWPWSTRTDTVYMAPLHETMGHPRPMFTTDCATGLVVVIPGHTAVPRQVADASVIMTRGLEAVLPGWRGPRVSVEPSPQIPCVLWAAFTLAVWSLRDTAVTVSVRVDTVSLENAAPKPLASPVVTATFPPACIPLIWCDATSWPQQWDDGGAQPQWPLTVQLQGTDIHEDVFVVEPTPVVARSPLDGVDIVVTAPKSKLLLLIQAWLRGRQDTLTANASESTAIVGGLIAAGLQVWTNDPGYALLLDWDTMRLVVHTLWGRGSL